MKNKILDNIFDLPNKINLGGSGIMFSLGVLTLNDAIMLGSLLIGILGFVVMWYYRHRNSKLYELALNKAIMEGVLIHEHKKVSGD